MKFEDLQKVNTALGTMDIKGKAYVLVNERVKAFRQLYPEGAIVTTLVKDEDGICTFKAEILGDGILLATGYAQEKESSSYINKTSYIENCETSAVGRALGFLGIGIDTSIASAEEVETAVTNQGIGPAKAKALRKLIGESGVTEKYVCELYKCKKLEDFTESMHMNAVTHMEEIRLKYKKEAGA